MTNLTRRGAGITMAAACLGAAGLLGVCAPAATGGEGLARRARRRGLSFGCMVTDADVADRPLAAAIRREADMIVPGVEMKWGVTEHVRGRPDYARAERIARFAGRHRLRLRGHAGFWYKNLPTWARDVIAGPDGERLALARCGDVVRHFRGRVFEWDVVNEAIEPKDGAPGFMRRAPFGRPTPIGFVADCFHAAHEADPGARLYYNDYAVECDVAEHEQRRQGVLALLTELKRRNVPVHGFGSQSHLAYGWKFEPERYRAFLRDVAALGLEIRITELDVADYLASRIVAISDQQVADYARAFLDVCLDERAVTGIVTWGLSDRGTWLAAEAWARRGRGIPPRPLPFDRELRRKPLWDAIARSIDAAPLRGPVAASARADRR